MEGRAGALQAGAGLATGSALQKATLAKLSNSFLHLDTDMDMDSPFC